MKLISWFSAAVAFLSFARAADLGDPAAELKIAKWVKGEPVTISADAKNIYVVEFWATWCPPCRTSIPHLTEMQKRFKEKNVTIIGITDEKQNVVASFVKSMGAKMDYRVAIDEDGETAKGYMEAYGANGIPHAFIVREKKVIWQGHPMDGLDKTLEEVIAGKYDVAAEKRNIRSMVLKDEFRDAVFKGQNEEAEEVGKKLLEIDPKADLKALRSEALVRKDVMAYFSAVAGRAEGNVDHKKLGAELAGKIKGQAELEDKVAWAILTDENVKHRDIPLALQIAKQAVEDSESKSASILDTYARALFDSDKKDEAVKAQEKAIAVASDEEKANLERTLKAYKEGKLPSAE